MKKKILIIPFVFPYPLSEGGAHGVFHYIDKLRDTYDISLLFEMKNHIGTHFDDLKTIWPNVTFYVFERPKVIVTQIIDKKKPTLAVIYDYIYSIPYRIKDCIVSKKQEEQVQVQENTDDAFKKQATLYRTFWLLQPDFVNYIATIANKGFDIIQVEFFEYISLANILPKDAEKIFIHHELRYIRNEIELNLLENPDYYDTYMYLLSKQFEMESLRLYNKIVTVSDIDQRKLEKELPDKTIISSPLIISKKEIPDYEYKFNNKLTFIGSATHFPNMDGVKWFIANIWSEINKKYPTLELHIIGKEWHPERFEGLSISNIFFDGFVENLHEALVNSISIVPIRIGSGMRMKIIEAVKCRIPFIATPVGVEGLDFINNTDCFIADTNINFIKSIEILLNDSILQKKFIQNSVAKLNTLYNENKLIIRRKAVYD